MHCFRESTARWWLLALWRFGHIWCLARALANFWKGTAQQMAVLEAQGRPDISMTHGTWYMVQNNILFHVGVKSTSYLVRSGRCTGGDSGGRRTRFFEMQNDKVSRLLRFSIVSLKVTSRYRATLAVAAVLESSLIIIFSALSQQLDVWGSLWSDWVSRAKIT